MLHWCWFHKEFIWDQSMNIHLRNCEFMEDSTNMAMKEPETYSTGTFCQFEHGKYFTNKLRNSQ